MPTVVFLMPGMSSHITEQWRPWRSPLLCYGHYVNSCEACLEEGWENGQFRFALKQRAKFFNEDGKNALPRPLLYVSGRAFVGRRLVLQCRWTNRTRLDVELQLWPVSLGVTCVIVSLRQDCVLFYSGSSLVGNGVWIKEHLNLWRESRGTALKSAKKEANQSKYDTDSTGMVLVPSWCSTGVQFRNTSFV